ncbi:MAG TPA: hypothetical protein VFZ59_10845 [Verrucomicrobiae bacterium]|nr:hypothetical protein [Verrucomicrobiae bacterium]
MKPSGARSLVSRGLEFLSEPPKTLTTTQLELAPLPELTADELAELDRRRQESLQQRARKQAEEAEQRSKLKTRRLVQLCGQVMHLERKSEGWFAKYEKFFRSPVWKLVSDEAIRKAHFKCEYWKCPRQAKQAHLLELPEKHLEANFDWMNRNDILIALCDQHHWMMHGFVMKRIVPLSRQFDSAPPGLSALAKIPRQAAAVSQV